MGTTKNISTILMLSVLTSWGGCSRSIDTIDVVGDTAGYFGSDSNTYLDGTTIGEGGTDSIKDIGSISDSGHDTGDDVGTEYGPEICDGIDNDGNGIVDDLDVGKDGICDCLNIGTIGRIGPWSTGGNIFKTWLDTRSPIPATELGDQEITPELIKGLQVIVVLRADTMTLTKDGSAGHHEFSPSEISALEDWVRDGGGLLTTIGYQADEAAEVQNVNRLLAPLGLRYHDESEHLGLDGMIRSWAEHPIADGVTSVKTVNGVEPVEDGGTTVAWDDKGDVAMVAATPGDGHVIVFGDEWITYDSEWENVADLQVERLWINMFKWLSPPEECQVETPVF